MVIGDDIYYKDHEFELLKYIRQKPMDKQTYQICSD